MSEEPSVLDFVRRPAVLRRSAAIALVVGTLLSAANQADLILRGPWNARLLAKILFNYAVPFVVATAGAAACARKER